MVTGFAAGAAQGYIAAHSAGRNPWTGELKLKRAIGAAPKGFADNYNRIPEGKKGNHLFKGANKLQDTPSNRALIEDISNSSLLGKDQYGKSWHARNLDNGTQIYSYSRNGIIKGAGINNTPVNIVERYNLKL